MPIFVIAIVGLASGWAIGAFLETQAGLRDRQYRGLLSFLAFLAGVVVFGITAGEAAHQAWAFQLEGALIEQRWCTALLWVVAGFAVYTFRGTIKAFLVDLIALALKAPASDRGAPAERREPAQEQRRIAEADARGARDVSGSKYLPLSIPWFIEAGIFGAVLVAGVLAFNPKILNSLTSFKAGGIEAHFATAGPILQKGQISVVDANRKSVLSNWEKFNIKDDVRTEIYRKNPGLKDWRWTFADSYFQSQINPVFEILSDREFSYKKFSSENFGKLQNISTRLADVIESNLDTRKKADSENSVQRQTFLLKKVSQEIWLFRCDTNSKKRPPNCGEDEAVAAATCWAKASLATYRDCQRQHRVKFPEAITQIEDRNRKAPERKTAENIWEPYIIQAVADLLGRSMGGRERANFLEVATSFLENDNGACSPTCTFPVPGQMSLVYADVEAKIDSEQPWPFDHMYQQVSDLLEDTRRIVDADDLHASTRAVGRRNRLIDLSLGLQLFYQRALSGQRFTPAQMQSWSEWLKETRAALNLLEDVGPEDPSLDDSEKAAWKSARDTIEHDPAVIQDAATASALSSVLLPAQGAGTSGADCLEARSLIDFASSMNLDRFYMALHFDPDEKAMYKGLIDQMKARVESECE